MAYQNAASRIPLVEVKGLKKYFQMRPSLLERYLAGVRERKVKAVDGIDLVIYRGETVGLVGESGCGKSTFGRTLVGLYPPTAGKILFNGVETISPGRRFLRNKLKRGSSSTLEDGARKAGSGYRLPVQMIFQNPYSSLNPRHTVRQIIGNALAQVGVPLQKREEETMSLLKRVGLEERHLDQYPRQFSGGQRQRIAVARALASRPQFIVADEPLSSLDVSVQAQVVNLLEDLQDELGLTYLMISHDLSVVHHMSHRIAVMYMGKLVEIAPSQELFEDPLHPYTRALLAAIPRIGLRKIPESFPDAHSPDKTVLFPEGDVTGCKFWPRCPEKMSICSESAPPEIVYSRGREPGMGHIVFCHRYS